MSNAVVEYLRTQSVPADVREAIDALLRLDPSARYEDLGPLGEGGMGAVRRVRDVELGRTLAMKTLHPELLATPAAVARFRQEAQATAQLQHPNIVTIGVSNGGS